KDDPVLIAKLCDRRFGIGADGLILLENDKEIDFRMVYFNADGKESTMCGNGGRCIVSFAQQLGLIGNETTFSAIDGLHHAVVQEDGRVALGMKDVESIEQVSKNEYVLDTGSPHYVIVVDEMPEDILKQAHAIRYNERFKKEGINVNFIVIKEDQIHIRTYERGVENETLACGTGAVAAAIVAVHYQNKMIFEIETRGDCLRVEILNLQNLYSKIILTGEAKPIFSGNFVA
ncbi:diaminopimelate epimerase, partial [Chitinophagales bacterium]|nr:diaminopimelate epimerase [Chitinophagales bacterium]